MLSGRMQVQHGRVSLVPGALGALTATTVSLPLDASRSQGVRLKQLKASYSYSGKTAFEGPLVCGFSIDLSAAEVTEAMTADPQHINDVPATEEGNRKVFPIWVVPFFATAGETGRDTQLEEVNLPWKELTEGQGIQFFIFNGESGALTTGMGGTLQFTAVQEWLRD